MNCLFGRKTPARPRVRGPAATGAAGAAEGVGLGEEDAAEALGVEAALPLDDDRTEPLESEARAPRGDAWALSDADRALPLEAETRAPRTSSRALSGVDRAGPLGA